MGMSSRTIASASILYLSCAICQAVRQVHSDKLLRWHHANYIDANDHHLAQRELQGWTSYPEVDFHQSVLTNDGFIHLHAQPGHLDPDHSRRNEALYGNGNENVQPLAPSQPSNLPTSSTISPIEVNEYFDLDDLSPEPYRGHEDMVDIDSHCTNTEDMFDPSYLLENEITPGDFPCPTNEKQVRRAEYTAFWKSLERHRKKKGELIDKYRSMTLWNGKPITRDAAATKLRSRCTEEIAKNLLSDDATSVESAKMCIDHGEGWKGQFLPNSEKAQLKGILTRHYRVSPLTAFNTVARGFRALPMKARTDFAMGEKGLKSLTALAGKMHKAYSRQKKKEYRKRRGISTIDEESGDEGHKTGSVEDSHATYWMLLSDHQRNIMMQRYSALTGMDKDEAWCKLCARCTEKIATALLSDDIESYEHAIALLEKVYRRQKDVLTREERALLDQQLDKRFGVETANQRKRMINIGLSSLDEESKTKIREDVRMDDDRFKELASMMWKSKQEYDHQMHLCRNI